MTIMYIRRTQEAIVIDESLYATTHGLGIPAVHDEHMRKAKKLPRAGAKKVTYTPGCIRAWRKKRGLTLQQLADLVGSTHATLSRIERGLQPYSQKLMERIAEALDTDVTSLIMYPPDAQDDIRAIWDTASAEERAQILRVAKALIKTNQ